MIHIAVILKLQTPAQLVASIVLSGRSVLAVQPHLFSPSVTIAEVVVLPS